MKRFLPILIVFLLIQFQGLGQCGAGETQVIIKVDGTLGSFNSEIYWKLFDQQDVLQLERVQGFLLDSAIEADTICLVAGESYRFEAYDSFGDGWNSATFSITYSDGFPLRSSMPNNGTAGSADLEEVFSFTVGDRPGDDCNLPALIDLNSDFEVNTALYTNAYQTDPLFDSGREAIFEFNPSTNGNFKISFDSIASLDRGSLQLFDNCLDSSPNRIAFDSTGTSKQTVSVVETLSANVSYFVVISNSTQSGRDSIKGNLRIQLLDPLPIPQTEVTTFTDSLHINFTNTLGQDEIFFTGLISDDNFATSSSLSVSSTVGELGVGNLLPSTNYSFKFWSESGNLSNSDTMAFEAQTEPLFISSIANGNWSDPNVWEGGVVPPADSAVNIYHRIAIIEGEKISTQSVNIAGGFQEESIVGLWIQNAELSVNRDVTVTTSSGLPIDSVGIFIANNGANATRFNVGNNLRFEINDASASDPLQFFALNTGDSLIVKVGNEFSFRQSASASPQFSKENIVFQDVDLTVGGNLFFFNNNFSSAQPFNAVFENSRLNISQFNLNAFENTNGSYQINFIGNSNVTVDFNFERVGSGGQIKFRDNSTLTLNGLNSQTLSGFGDFQDSILYNNIAFELRGVESINTGKPTVALAPSNEETVTNLLIDGAVNFFNGVVQARSGFQNLVEYNVIFTERATTSFVTPTSYIDGAVTKYGLSDFIFPVGQSEGPRPIGLTDINGTVLTSDFLKVNTINNFCGDSTFLLNEPTGFAGVRTEEYWNIEALLSDPNQNIQIQPFFVNFNKEGISELSSLSLLNFNLGTSLGNSSTTGSSFATSYDFNQGVNVRLGLGNTVSGENSFYLKREVISASSYTAAPGETITLTYSSGFASVNDKVYFNGMPANVSNASGNSIDVMVPLGARSGKIVINSQQQGLLYPNFIFTVKSPNNTPVSATNYANIEVIGSITGDLLQSESKLQLGQFDADAVFDAMIVTAGYDNVTTVKNLSGTASFEEFQLESEGMVLTPNSFETDLSNLIGTARYDVVFNVGEPSSAGIIYFRNDGSGNFSPLGDGSADPSTSYSDFSFTDLTFDGVTDIAYSVFGNSGESNFSTYSFIDYDPSECLPNVTYNAYQESNFLTMDKVLSGDYDKDGEKDFVYLIDAESRFGLASNFNTNAPTFTLADSRGPGLITDAVNISLTGDGTTQFVATNQSENSIEIYSFNEATGAFITSTTVLTFTPFNLKAEDINGDGFQDLIVNSQDAPELHIFLNDGIGNFSPEFTINMGQELIASFEIIDLNNDSYKDILTLQEGGALSISYFALERSLETDVLALRQFYEDTNGDAWSSIVWDTTGVDPSQWSTVANDIVVEGNRVVELNLPENNLSDTVSTSLSDITELRAIDLSGNAISVVEDLSNLINLTSLNLSGNALDFDDIERNLSIVGFDYSNQAFIGEAQNERLPLGSAYELSYSIGGANNVYQWYRNDQLVNGEDRSSILIDSINFDNMGEYRLEIVNSLVNQSNPDFRLNTNSVNILATATLSGKAQNANEVPTESGRVYLFKVNTIGEYDSVLVDGENFFQNLQSNGFFELTNIELGDYVLFVNNDENANPNLLNTYFPSTIDWELAEVLNLRSSITELIVSMEQVPQEASGTSSLSGYLEEEFEEGERQLPRRRVSGVGGSVRRLAGSSRDLSMESILQNGELVAYVETDANGEFIIPNLSAGRYRIKFDIPGVPMDEESDVVFELTGANREALEIAALSDNGRISVNRISYTGNKEELLKIATVYPNPSTGRFIVEGTEAVLDIKVMTQEGRVIKELSNVKKGDNEIEIDLSNYPSGLYFLQTLWRDGKRTLNKLIKE